MVVVAAETVVVEFEVEVPVVVGTVGFVVLDFGAFVVVVAVGSVVVVVAEGCWTIFPLIHYRACSAADSS